MTQFSQIARIATTKDVLNVWMAFFYKLMVRNALLVKIHLQAANSAQLLFIVNNVRKGITWNIFHSVF